MSSTPDPTPSDIGRLVRVRRRIFNTETGRTVERFSWDGTLTREGHECIYVDHGCVSTATADLPNGTTMETSWEVLEPTDAP